MTPIVVATESDANDKTKSKSKSKTDRTRSQSRRATSSRKPSCEHSNRQQKPQDCRNPLKPLKSSSPRPKSGHKLAKLESLQSSKARLFTGENLCVQFLQLASPIAVCLRIVLRRFGARVKFLPLASRESKRDLRTLGCSGNCRLVGIPKPRASSIGCVCFSVCVCVILRILVAQRDHDPRITTRGSSDSLARPQQFPELESSGERVALGTAIKRSIATMGMPTTGHFHDIWAAFLV